MTDGSSDRPVGCIEPGSLRGAGTHGGYRGLQAVPRPQPVVREDLVAGPGGSPVRRLGTIGHLTDLHLADVGSPVRLEFAMREGAGDPRWRGLVDWVFRPHELLTSHAAAAMVRTLRAEDLDLVVVTGDNIDNAQRNELDAYLDLLDGGPVDLWPAGRYEGVQDRAIGDDWYWTPENVPDRYKRAWGFPSWPGLTDRAAQRIHSEGLGHPWLACAGNHDLLVGGSCPRYEDLATLVTASAKPVLLPDTIPDDPLHTYLTEPLTLFGGPARPVTAHEGRRFVGVEEFVRAHRSGRAVPDGHGFDRDDRPYYSYDVSEHLRVIVLSTDNLRGHWDGTVEAEQFDWLRDQLGAARGPGAPYVVLASHHASRSMENTFGVCEAVGHPVISASELVELAADHPRVLLWLNGHHHANRVVAHPGAGGGFFEVTTSAVVDWPSQARVLEIVEEPDGIVRIESRMVDHHGVIDPWADPAHPEVLAGLHRELAFNDSVRAGRTGVAGLPGDRDVVLRVPAV